MRYYKIDGRFAPVLLCGTMLLGGCAVASNAPVATAGAATDAVDVVAVSKENGAYATATYADLEALRGVFATDKAACERFFRDLIALPKPEVPHWYEQRDWDDIFMFLPSHIDDSASELTPVGEDKAVFSFVYGGTSEWGAERIHVLFTHNGSEFAITGVVAMQDRQEQTRVETRNGLAWFVVDNFNFYGVGTELRCDWWFDFNGVPVLRVQSGGSWFDPPDTDVITVASDTEWLSTGSDALLRYHYTVDTRRADGEEASYAECIAYELDEATGAFAYAPAHSTLMPTDAVAGFYWRDECVYAAYKHYAFEGMTNDVTVVHLTDDAFAKPSTLATVGQEPYYRAVLHSSFLTELERELTARYGEILDAHMWEQLGNYAETVAGWEENGELHAPTDFTYTAVNERYSVVHVLWSHTDAFLFMDGAEIAGIACANDKTPDEYAVEEVAGLPFVAAYQRVDGGTEYDLHHDRWYGADGLLALDVPSYLYVWVLQDASVNPSQKTAIVTSSVTVENGTRVCYQYSLQFEKEAEPQPAETMAFTYDTAAGAFVYDAAHSTIPEVFIDNALQYVLDNAEVIQAWKNEAD